MNKLILLIIGVSVYALYRALLVNAWNKAPQLKDDDDLTIDDLVN